MDFMPEEKKQECGGEAAVAEAFDGLSMDLLVGSAMAEAVESQSKLAPSEFEFVQQVGIEDAGSGNSE